MNQKKSISLLLCLDIQTRREKDESERERLPAALIKRRRWRIRWIKLSSSSSMSKVDAHLVENTSISSFPFSSFAWSVFCHRPLIRTDLVRAYRFFFVFNRTDVYLNIQSWMIIHYDSSVDHCVNQWGETYISNREEKKKKKRRTSFFLSLSHFILRTPLSVDRLTSSRFLTIWLWSTCVYEQSRSNIWISSSNTLKINNTYEEDEEEDDGDVVQNTYHWSSSRRTNMRCIEGSTIRLTFISPST